MSSPRLTEQNSKLKITDKHIRALVKFEQASKYFPNSEGDKVQVLKLAGYLQDLDDTDIYNQFVSNTQLKLTPEAEALLSQILKDKTDIRVFCIEDIAISEPSEFFNSLKNILNKKTDSSLLVKLESLRGPEWSSMSSEDMERMLVSEFKHKHSFDLNCGDLQYQSKPPVSSSTNKSVKKEITNSSMVFASTNSGTQQISVTNNSFDTETKVQPISKYQTEKNALLRRIEAQLVYLQNRYEMYANKIEALDYVKFRLDPSLAGEEDCDILENIKNLDMQNVVETAKVKNPRALEGLNSKTGILLEEAAKLTLPITNEQKDDFLRRIDKQQIHLRDRYEMYLDKIGALNRVKFYINPALAKSDFEIGISQNVSNLSMQQLINNAKKLYKRATEGLWSTTSAILKDALKLNSTVSVSGNLSSMYYPKPEASTSTQAQNRSNSGPRQF